jgi:hypothetical protein
MRQSSALLMLAVMAAGCTPSAAVAPTPTNAPTSAQLAEERARVQAALFSDPALCSEECWWESPGLCADPCFWSLPVGEMTREEWGQFLEDTFPATLAMYRDDELLTYTGWFANTNEFLFERTDHPQVGPDGIGAIRLTVHSVDRANDYYDLAAISPSTLLRYFGAPDAAYLQMWRSSNQTGFHITFWYRAPALNYDIEGTMDNGTLCLGLDNLQAIQLRRTLDREVSQADIERRWPSPPWLEDHILESLDDLPQLAAESDAPCLTLR